MQPAAKMAGPTYDLGVHTLGAAGLVAMDRMDNSDTAIEGRYCDALTPRAVMLPPETHFRRPSSGPLEADMLGFLLQLPLMPLLPMVILGQLCLSFHTDGAIPVIIRSRVKDERPENSSMLLAIRRIISPSCAPTSDRKKRQSGRAEQICFAKSWTSINQKDTCHDLMGTTSSSDLMFFLSRGWR